MQGYGSGLYGSWLYGLELTATVDFSLIIPSGKFYARIPSVKFDLIISSGRFNLRTP